MASPFSWMTFGMTFTKWLMYFLHLDIVTVLQNLEIPSINSFFVVGLTSRLINSLSSCHRFSMGLRSGDSAGVFHQLIPLSKKYALASLEVCLGSLSCMNWWPSGNLAFKKGSKVFRNISTYRGASIIPSKMQISVEPIQLIPAHTWTFIGCFGLGLFLGGSPLFLQQNLLWVSSCTVVSSVQTTFSKSWAMLSLAHCNRFSLLACLISWQ